MFEDTLDSKEERKVLKMRSHIWHRGLALALCASLSVGFLTACGDDDESDVSVADADSDSDNVIIITLYPDYAPITCENFQSLVEEGFYDGLTFHRVVDDFVAQGGDPNGDGTGGSDTAITGEFSDNGIENDLSHTRGVISMARSDDYDSATSQFFICLADCTYLDGSYAAFGEVTEGMDVVDSFTEVERTTNSAGEEAVPTTDIVIESAVMIEDDEDGNPRVQFTMNDFLGESEEE